MPRLTRPRRPKISGFAQPAFRWQNYSQENDKLRPARPQGRIRCWNRRLRAWVGPFAGMDVPWLLRMRSESRRGPSVPDLGTVRRAGANLALRRIPRAGRRAGRRPCGARHQAGRICVDPSGQLHRGHAGVVRLRRTRRHRRHHQHPLGAGGDGIFCRTLRRRRRDHAAWPCRNDLRALPEFALAGGDFARRRRRPRAGHRSAARRQFRSAVRRQRRPAAPRHRSLRAVQCAIYLRHHVAAEGGAVDPRQCAVGRQGQRRA